MNQSVKGFRDSSGKAIQNAHLISLFHRCCKLLFFKIKPVAVFDGKAPELKKKTLEDRQKRRQRTLEDSQKSVNRVLMKYLSSQFEDDIDEPSASYSSDYLFSSFLPTDHVDEEDMFCVKEPQENVIESPATASSIDEVGKFQAMVATKLKKYQNMDDLDVASADFLSLPPEIRHEILNELKDKRKGYTKLKELPKESTDFSTYQMSRLLHKQTLQKHIQNTIDELNEKQPNSDGGLSSVEAGNIASEEGTEYFYLNSTKNSSHSRKLRQRIIIKEKLVRPNKRYEDILGIASEYDYGKADAVEADGSSLMNKAHILSDSPKVVSIKENEPEMTIDEDLLVELNKSMHESMHEPTQTLKSDKADNEFSSLIAPEAETTFFKEKISISSPCLEDAVEDDVITVGIISDDESSDTDCELIEEDEGEEEEDSATSQKSNVAVKSFDVSKAPNAQPAEVDISSIPKVITKSSSSLGRRVSLRGKVLSEAHVCSHANEDIDMQAGTSSQSSSVSNNKSPAKRLPVTRNMLSRDDIVELKKSNEAERYALKVSEKMASECKELLQLFGIPYIDSPTEAESQCAALENIGLSDGTITDDSDIWLFGGKVVFKNFFTQSKYVEMYKASEIEQHFKLSREAMICLALLTGSDYTAGIEGVGPVTGIEILSEFSGDGLDPLKKFKSWLDVKQKTSDKTPGNKIRAKLMKIKVDDGFPSHLVYDCYLHPTVDTSPEKFSWARPDLDLLRQYAQDKFGWSQGKVDDILLPVLKKLNEVQRQMRIDNYFKVSLKKDATAFPSKRVAKALGMYQDKSSPTKGKKPALERGKLKEKVRKQRLPNRVASATTTTTTTASSTSTNKGSKTTKERLGTTRDKTSKADGQEKQNKKEPKKTKKNLIETQSASGTAVHDRVLLSETSCSDSDDEAARRVCL